MKQRISVKANTRVYTYETALAVKVGDLVVCPTKIGGHFTGEVVAVPAPPGGFPGPFVVITEMYDPTKEEPK